MRDEDKTKEQLLTELQTLRMFLERTEMRCSREPPRLPIDRLPLAYIRFDKNYRVLDWNPAAEKTFGYTKEEMLGRVALDALVPLPLNDQLREIVRRIQVGDMDAHSVNENRTKDGRTMTCEWFNTPLVDSEGQFAGVICLARDITDRRRAEEKLRRSEALLAEAERLSHIGSWEWHIPTGALTWSEEMYRIFGLDPEYKVTFDAFLERVHPDDRAAIVAINERSLRDHAAFESSFRIVRPDGGVRTLQGCGRVVVDESGTAVSLVGVREDVTQRKRAERELRESEERFRNSFDHAPVGMYLTGLDGRWLKVNHALCNIVGYAEEELLAMTWEAITHPDDLEADIAHVRRLVAGETAYYHMEKRYIHKDGHIVWILLGGSLVRDAQDRPLYFVGHVQDITLRKRAEGKLLDYSERVQALSRRLLSAQEEERRHLARELHDELGQILGAINFQLHAVRGLAGTAALPRLEECATLVQQAGEQVRSLALELRPTMLDVLGLEAALRGLGERHHQWTGCEVQIVPGLSGPPLSSDLTIACFRLVQEALTNVVRHAAARHVRIELSQSERAVELVVQDDGVGFAMAHTQEQATRRGSLGLVGMRERIQILGCSLAVESEPGRGTRIHASIPLNQVADAQAEPAE